MVTALRKTALSVALLSLGIAMSATAQTSPAPSAATTGGSPAGASSSARSAAANDKLSHGDRKFIEEAAQGGMAEVQLGQLATQKAQSDQVKQFGQKMVDDHSKMLQDLRTLAKKKNVALPQDPDMKDMAQMKLMERKSGAEFDKDFMEHMVKDHEKDLKDVQNIAAKAKDPEFKAAVQKAHAKIQEHLQLAQRISKSAAAGSSSKK